ncbi:gluconate 2-dehydrogenase subunit 3 family protein [Dyadobacter sp. CY356]|uniref:gluconate 2-dehydrogenase subunit 3 family protein n=1 Tax=Dyadobacter sp. CY356 TaxID=2906442 RepID=UPI001F3E107A|nr:gluconate 2-dehydrogenase subunit 3 family protein [Dyadobacter sp. CY356]MCF0058153.1 gluconate 2-dehydrogenase subunit 3 family protein [Dyadobacter sp. CY356]
MERRIALKGMAAAIGAIVSLPAWASGWNDSSLGNVKFSGVGQAEILKVAVEAIIPKTDTPGAGELGVATFVQRMVTDCYDKKTQDVFAKGIAGLDAQSNKSFGKAFTEASKTQQTQLLQELEKSSDSETKSFFGLLKNLTIQGYMSSEYVMTNLTHFEFIPGRYHGCVPVAKG